MPRHPDPDLEERILKAAQALWKRVVIVLAGPAMNVFFPIVLYTSVFLEDDRAAPPPTTRLLDSGCR